MVCEELVRLIARWAPESGWIERVEVLSKTRLRVEATDGSRFEVVVRVEASR